MKQRILAVDDELHMLKLLERIITDKTAYQITVTNNALEAVEMLSRDRFDLIITDLKMPGMDGMDLLRKVKEGGGGEEVIIITAFGSLETAIEALSQGVFDYITKPFKKEQIIYTVDRAMRWQRTRREADRLARIFEREPWEKARATFEREYVRRLAQRAGGDRQQMAQRSGLSADQIKTWLEEVETEDRDS